MIKVGDPEDVREITRLNKEVMGLLKAKQVLTLALKLSVDDTCPYEFNEEDMPCLKLSEQAQIDMADKDCIECAMDYYIRRAETDCIKQTLIVET